MKTIRLIGYGLLLTIALAYAGFTLESYAARASGIEQVTLPPVLILDDTFEAADWSLTVEATGGATVTVTQQLTGGAVSPPYRFISHRLPPASNDTLVTLLVTHIYLNDTYDPSVQGAISDLDYSEYGIILSFPFSDAFSTSQPVVRQDGRIYRSTQFLRFIAENASHAWESKALSQLVATDFVAIDGSGENPDFSVNGGAIQFGFTRSNSRGSTQPAVPNDQDMVIDQGVDHVQWLVRRQSEVQENRPPRAENDTFILDGYKRSLPLFEIFDLKRNDSDPDLDSLEVIEVTEPTFGSAGILSQATVVYQLDEAQAFDSFGYVISDDVLTGTAQVEVYIDCACTVLCLNQLEPPPLTSLQTADAIDLPLIYRVRDQILKATLDGRRYVEMYYQSNPEILVNIVTNEQLRNESLVTIELWQAPLRSLADGDGSALITQAQIDGLRSFLNNLAAVSSSKLQQIIAAELQRLGPLDNYVGMTVNEAKSMAIGDPAVYLPHIVSRP